VPKLKKKILTKTLYLYVTRENDKWVRKTAKKSKMSYSMLLNGILTAARKSAPILAAALLMACGREEPGSVYSTVSPTPIVNPVRVEIWGDQNAAILVSSTRFGSWVEFSHRGTPIARCIPVNR
jgi:hypothetical protein